MQVMSDFFSYKEGIFFSKTNRNQGGHAVELVGFGKIPEDDEAFDASDETKQYYWICKNSWGPRSGEGGFFRIRMDQRIAYNAGTFEADLDAFGVGSFQARSI